MFIATCTFGAFTYYAVNYSGTPVSESSEAAKFSEPKTAMSVAAKMAAKLGADAKPSIESSFEDNYDPDYDDIYDFYGEMLQDRAVSVGAVNRLY